jgi:hypothetical protein
MAMIVVFTASTHPKVEIPDDGLCPPSDAILNFEFGVIQLWTSLSGYQIDTLPMMCSS